ncbi:MAG: o-succinylbenzoate synthase [Aquihabitans sp.]
MATDLIRVQMPLRHPLRSARGTETVRDVILVRVVGDDGVAGWGECSALARPTYTAEYTDAAWAVLRDHLVAGLDVVGHPMAVAALRGAEQDAALRRQNRSLVDRVASRLGRPATAVARTAVIGRQGTVAGLVAEVADRMAAGAAMVKLKATPHPDDLAAVAEVRATFPDLALAVDGNGTLDSRSVTMLDGLGLVYIEQPAPADDLVTSARLARRCDTPIALDESVTSAAVLETAAAIGAGAVVNIKPARLGGVNSAVETIAVATDVGWSMFVGGMLETGVGRAAALALAASPACTLPTDLGPSDHYFVRDITEPILVDDRGQVLVPTGTGIGVTPIDAVLDEVTVDRLTFS